MFMLQLNKSAKSKLGMFSLIALIIIISIINVGGEKINIESKFEFDYDSKEDIYYKDLENIRTKINNSGNIEISKWNEEVYMVIEKPNVYPILTLTNVEQINSKLISKTSNTVDLKYYFKEFNNVDSFEYEIILKEKPSTNVISSKIKTENLDFYIQLDGSYAVYHSNKQGNEYGNGKVFHIYRPLIIDNNNDSIYADLDISNGFMNITINNNWLDKASYPVIVDPTFGYTTAGSNGYSFEDNISGSNFTITEDGTAINISAYVSVGFGDKGKFAIYYPNGTFIEETEEKTLLDESWQTFDLNSDVSLEANINYVLVGWANGNSVFHADIGEANQGYHDEQIYNGFPNPSTFTHTNLKYSIYITYEIPNVAPQIISNNTIPLVVSLDDIFYINTRINDTVPKNDTIIYTNFTVIYPNSSIIMDNINGTIDTVFTPGSDLNWTSSPGLIADDGGTYLWYLNTSDGILENTSFGEFTISDTTSPIILNITSPTNDTEYFLISDIDINYSITDDMRIDSVWFNIVNGSNPSQILQTNTSHSYCGTRNCGNNVSLFSFPIYNNLTLNLYVNDTSGNEQTAQVVGMNVTTDTSLPIMTITNPSGLKTSFTIPINYVIIDNVGVQSVKWNITRDNVQGVLIDFNNSATSSFSGSITLGTTTEGTYIFNIEATDVNGNSDSTTSTFNIDLTEGGTGGGATGGGGGGVVIIVGDGESEIPSIDKFVFLYRGDRTNEDIIKFNREVRSCTTTPESVCSISEENNTVVSVTQKIEQENKFSRIIEGELTTTLRGGDVVRVPIRIRVVNLGWYLNLRNIFQLNLGVVGEFLDPIFIKADEGVLVGLRILPILLIALIAILIIFRRRLAKLRKLKILKEVRAIS